MDSFPELEKERGITIVPQTPEAPPPLLPNDRAALENILIAVFSRLQDSEPASSPSADS